MNTTADLTRRLRAKAADLGFDGVGICEAQEAAAWPKLNEWLSRNYDGNMAWLRDRLDAYKHPRSVLAEVRSLVMLTKNYRTEEPVEIGRGQGKISRYAWGSTDYHDTIHDLMRQFCAWMEKEVPGSRSRGVVDTAPLLERQFAQVAGLGWQGKNTLLLQPDSGSLFFLSAFLTDVELEYETPFETDHCGTCTACLDACPTDAFPEPYVLDARRCISYLTIELREDIPLEFRSQMDGWLFGCDVCQNVCPWNRHSPITDDRQFEPIEGSNPVELCELLMLDDDSFQTRFRRTPLWRTKRRGVLRNAAILLGAQPDDEYTPALANGLNDDEPLIRSACAWALGQVASPAATTALSSRQPIETESNVQAEIIQALAK